MKQFNKTKSGLLAAVIMTAGAIPCANAWTAKQLVDYCEGNATELIGSYGNQNSLAVGSRPVTVSLNGSYLRINNFLGDFAVDFQVSGNTVTALNITTSTFPSTTGLLTQLTGQTVKAAKLQRVIRSDAYIVNGAYVLNADQKMSANSNNNWNYLICTELATLTNNQINSFSGFSSKAEIRSLRQTWQGTISEDENGNLQILFGPYNSYSDSNSVRVSYLNASGTAIGYDIYDSYVLTLYKPNARVVDNKFPGGYNVSVTDIDGNQNYNFGITNFANMGTQFANYNINGSPTGSSWQQPYYEYDNIKGLISGTQVTIPQQPAFASLSGLMDATHNESVLANTNFYTIGFDAATGQPRADKAITGRVTGSDGVYHTGNNSWHHSLVDGDLHTLKGGQTIELDPYGFTDNVSQTTSWANTYRNTTITLSNPTDVTFNIGAMELEDISHDPNKDFIWENGVKKYFVRIGTVRLHDVINFNYVQHLQLWVVDDEHYTTATVPLENARLIGWINTPGDEADKEDMIEEYNKKFYPTVFWNPATNKMEMKTKYSFFVKAIYKEGVATDAPGVRTAANLADTHHVLLTKNLNFITTGVNGVEASDGIQVQPTAAGVVVNGPQGIGVQVVNMSGMVVATGVTNSEITIDDKGVFMVKAGNQVFKLAK